jgi:hypothetical protein
MLELVKAKLPVKIDDVVHELRSPTYRDSLEYENKLKDLDDPKLKADALFSYLESLGLPRNVSESLEIGHITQILTYVTGEKKR